MRPIRPLAALGAVLLGLVLFTGTAHAQTDAEIAEEAEHIAEEHGADLGARECVKKIVEGEFTTLDQCQEAPNPLFPAKNELIWGSLGFIVVFLFMRRFAYPAIKQGMEARAQRIRDDLDSAERQKTEAHEILQQYQRQLAEAQGEAVRIIEEARQSADAVRRDLVARAEADAADIRARATADIDTMVGQARADLQSRIAEMSIQLAERVVERNLDRDTNLALVESLIRELEAQGA